MADTSEALFQEAKNLIERAHAIGVVINLSMPSTKQKQTYGTTDAVVVAPDTHASGKTLFYPTPSRTGQKFL